MLLTAELKGGQTFCGDANANRKRAHILNYYIMKLLTVSLERKEKGEKEKGSFLFFMFLTLYREVLAGLEL